LGIRYLVGILWPGGEGRPAKGEVPASLPSRDSTQKEKGIPWRYKLLIAKYYKLILELTQLLKNSRKVDT